MARINTEVTADYFELIRDNIAAILLEELANQAALSGNDDLNFTEIWKERITPFDLAELPAINLSVSQVPYEGKFRGDREANPVYFIDIHLAKKHTVDDFADKLAMEGAWRIGRVIQYILDHDEYKDLLLKPHVRHTEVRSIKAGDAEMEGGGKCSAIRVEFLAETWSTTKPIEVLPFTGSTVTVKLNETEQGFIYKTELND